MKREGACHCEYITYEAAVTALAALAAYVTIPMAAEVTSTRVRTAAFLDPQLTATH
jgi:hypothetical protein